MIGSHFSRILTLPHRHNSMQSVVAGQAPITLEWRNTSVKTKTTSNKIVRTMTIITEAHLKRDRFHLSGAVAPAPHLFHLSAAAVLKWDEFLSRDYDRTYCVGSHTLWNHTGRTTVSFWGLTIQIPSTLSHIRDCSPKSVTWDTGPTEKYTE